MTVQKQVDIASLSSAVKVPEELAKRFEALGIRRAALDVTLHNIMQKAVEAINEETIKIETESKLLWDETAHTLGLAPTSDLNLESSNPANSYVFSGQEYREAAAKLGLELCGDCASTVQDGGAEDKAEQIHDSAL